jgi:RimJ/RimL family protein N-acetyltransferase
VVKVDFPLRTARLILRPFTAGEVLRLAFEEFGRHRVIGRIDARNEASGRVVERLGMRREAHFVQNELLKGEWTDEVVYAVLDHEWQSRAERTAAP